MTDLYDIEWAIWNAHREEHPEAEPEPDHWPNWLIGAALAAHEQIEAGWQAIRNEEREKVLGALTEHFDKERRDALKREDGFGEKYPEYPAWAASEAGAAQAFAEVVEFLATLKETSATDGAAAPVEPCQCDDEGPWAADCLKKGCQGPKGAAVPQEGPTDGAGECEHCGADDPAYCRMKRCERPPADCTEQVEGKGSDEFLDDYELSGLAKQVIERLEARETEAKDKLDRRKNQLGSRVNDDPGALVAYTEKRIYRDAILTVSDTDLERHVYRTTAATPEVEEGVSGEERAALEVARDALDAWEFSSKESDEGVRDKLFAAAPVVRAALSASADSRRPLLETLLDIRWLLGRAEQAFTAGKTLEAWSFVDRARWKAGVPQPLPRAATLVPSGADEGLMTDDKWSRLIRLIREKGSGPGFHIEKPDLELLLREASNDA